ncbi:MAG: tetratricopeptide repeat protein [Rhizobacter sp.]|nr:tetratricopeptide repeat protein [Chlorobiales bacterium]
MTLRRFRYIALLCYALLLCQPEASAQVLADTASLRTAAAQAFASGNYGAAATAYKKLSARASEDADSVTAAGAFVRLGECYFSLSQPTRAIAAYNNALRFGAEDADAYEGLGFAYDAVWNDAKAEEAFKNAIRLRPAGTRAYIRLSLSQMKLRRHQEAFEALGHAIALLDDAIRIAPDSADARLSRGLAHLVSGDWNEATKELEPLRRINPDYAARLDQLIANARTQSAQRLAYLTRLVKARPKSADAQLRLGIAHLSLKQYGEAVENFKRAVQLKPTDEALRLLGVAHSFLSEWSEAAAAYEAAIKLNLKEPFYRNNLGTIYGRLNRLEDAMASYREAIRLKPDLAIAYTNLGMTLLNFESTLSLKFLREFTRLRVEVPYPNLNRSIQDPYLARYDTTLSLFRTALRLVPNSAEAYMGLGAIYARCGYDEKSIAYLQDAIRYRPDFVAAYMSLGIVLARGGNTAKALDMFERAKSFQPDAPDAYLELGRLYTAMGRYREAMENYREAVRLKPDDADARFNLGASYLKLGERAAAMKELEFLRPLSKDLADKLYALAMR